jgi:hypothetical protein
MDSGTIITGVIFLLIFIIIFWIISRSNQKKEKELLQSLRLLAQEHNHTISQYDTWSNTAIGIDHTANTIIMVRKINEQPTSYRVNLAEMQKCRMLVASRPQSNEAGSDKVIEKLELAFTSNKKQLPETTVEFYNAAYDNAVLSGELQLLEKWQKIATSRFNILSLKK